MFLDPQSTVYLHTACTNCIWESCCSTPLHEVHLFVFYSLCAISMPSVFSFWKAEQRWLHDDFFFFFFLLEQTAIWLL